MHEEPIPLWLAYPGAIFMMALMLAVTVYVFWSTFKAIAGVTKTLVASPASTLEAMGFQCTSDALGGQGWAEWNGVAVRVYWKMRTGEHYAEIHAPSFSTLVTAQLLPPLGLGLDLAEQTKSPPFGVPQLDHRMLFQATDHGRAVALLEAASQPIVAALEMPGALHLSDDAVSIMHQGVILSDRAELRQALDGTTTIASTLRAMVGG